MAAADAAGDPATAIEAARKMTELEGFGQQWISLAILAARQGDRATEDAALTASAANLPIDPMVELNAIALLGARRRHGPRGRRSSPAAGGPAGHRAHPAQRPRTDGLRRRGRSGRRGPPEDGRRGSWDAFLVALSGEDRALSDELLGRVAADATGDGGLPWPTIVAAWFGDTAARASLDASARAAPTLDKVLWSWRLAGRACDKKAMTYWERAADIGYSVRPATPKRLDLAPTASVRQLPHGYPQDIWRQGRIPCTRTSPGP